MLALIISRKQFVNFLAVTSTLNFPPVSILSRREIKKKTELEERQQQQRESFSPPSSINRMPLTRESGPNFVEAEVFFFIKCQRGVAKKNYLS